MVLCYVDVRIHEKRFRLGPESRNEERFYLSGRKEYSSSNYISDSGTLRHSRLGQKYYHLPSKGNKSLYSDQAIPIFLCSGKCVIAYRGIADLFPHVGAISAVNKLFECHREHKER